MISGKKECVNLDFAFEDNFSNWVQFLKYKRGSRHMSKSQGTFDLS